MPVYVDDYRAPFRGSVYSHMMADTVEELHAMADQIGLKREWFQQISRPHYDVSENKRVLAIEHGAIEMTSHELVKHFMEKGRHTS